MTRREIDARWLAFRNNDHNWKELKKQRDEADSALYRYERELERRWYDTLPKDPEGLYGLA
jgi:hypothetical protein